MIVERVQRRVLGAVRFTDAVTGLVIMEPLVVGAAGVRWIRNRRGCYVLAGAPGLEAHADTFAAPPAAPPVGSVQVRFTVSDPGGRYLARRGSIDLPREPDPNQASSLFRLVDIMLFPAPTAATWPGWAVVRASVSGAGPGTVLAGALIRVVRTSDDVRLGSGMTDARGEALVAVEGIPSTTFGEGPGPVLATEVAVRLDVVHDPTTAGTAPDPDDLEARRGELLVRSGTATLQAGRRVTKAL